MPAGGLESDNDWRLYLKAAVVTAIVAAVVVLIVQSGVIGRFSDEDELQRTVEDAGVWGPLLFVGLMVLLVPLNVPGLIFVVPATTIFGTVPGISLSLVGGFLASAVGIVGARMLGRERFEARMPPRIRQLEARMARRGFWGVVLVRCFTFLLQPVDWLCGLSSMPMRTVLAGTFVGLVPPTMVIGLTGGGVIDILL